MLGAPISSPAAVASYEARGDQAVAVLAEACGADVAVEVARFGRIRAALSGRGPTPVFELVATLADGRARGFGYLTQGAAAASLPESLHGLLEGTLMGFLSEGGELPAARRVGELFATAFPELSTLERYASGSQALVVGFVPRGAQLALKLYFNTRLDRSRPHRDGVIALLGAAHVDPAAAGCAYDAIYGEGAAFAGVGVDVAAVAALRTKLYVRCHRQALAGVCARLDALVPQAVGARVRALVDAACARLEPASLADELEVGLALHADGAPSLKVTVFFAGALLDDDAEAAALAAIREAGQDAGVARRLCAALSADVVGVTQRGALHGLGFEVEPEGRPKLNVYALPVL